MNGTIDSLKGKLKFWKTQVMNLWMNPQLPELFWNWLKHF
jgi:hypothetical protein